MLKYIIKSYFVFAYFLVQSCHEYVELQDLCVGYGNCRRMYWKLLHVNRVEVLGQVTYRF
jgi:hypothetical protein